MSKLFARFLKDESGATAIEYGLIAALISLALITGGTLVGNQLDAKFTAAGEALEAAPINTGAGTGGSGGSD
jgi:pilus assembly protein Flp/PilA